MKNFFKAKGIKGIIFSLVITMIFFILLITDAFLGINNFFMDRIYQKERTTNKDIFIVAIDDKSLDELGPISSWNREYYATVVNNLASNNPSVIGLDILFTGESNPVDDQALVDACKDKNVVCGSNLIFGNKIDNNGDYFTVESSVVGVSYPYDDLNDVVDTGYVNALLDKEDSVVRKIIPIMEYDEEYVSFSYKIYEKYCEYNGYKINKYNNNEAYRINYASNPGEGYTTISFSDVYNGIVPSDIDGAIVLVGAYAAGLQDAYYTPIKSGVLTNGVEIHANIIDAYTKDDLVVESNKALMIISILIIISLFAYLIYKSHIIFSSSISILLILASFGVQSLFYINNIYFPMFSLMIGILVSYVAYIGFKYGEELYKKYKMIGVFKKYVAPQVVDKALKDVSYKVNVEGEKRHIACLFVDIRGFTPLSEGLDPIDVVSILNEYLTLTTNSVFEVEGTLDKFIGDATMAIFNAPFNLDDYMFKAVKAAWLIAKGSEEIDKMAMEKYGKHVSFGIGVNCGYAVVGNIGSKTRVDYTAIGDTVNTAARLEANAKAGEILISEALYNEVKDRVEAEFIGGLKLKGKSEEVNTYKVLSIKEDI